MKREDVEDAIAVAGNGLLDRRMLLRSAVAAGVGFPLIGGAAADAALPGATPPWMLTPGNGFSAYGVPGAHQKEVKRIITPMDGYDLVGTSRTPLHLLEGTITPNGLHFERHHNGIPDIDPLQHRLVICGLVSQPLSFDLNSLMRYPMESRIRFIECGGNSGFNARPVPPQMTAGMLHGLISQAEWTGVSLAMLLRETGIDPTARWIIAEGADAAAMSRSIPIEKCLDDAMVALYQNGEALRPEQGYPMRLLLPGFEGNMQIKWLHRLKLVAQPGQTRDETSHYTDLQRNGIARQFVLKTRVKSVILKPSYGLNLNGPGLYQISGIAWAAGKVAKVEVSADGGESWGEALIDTPAFSGALVRFRMPWRWDGGPSLLMSRAIDDGGNVQPLRRDFVANLSPGQRYHYHAIQSWGLDSAGMISNVYV